MILKEITYPDPKDYYNKELITEENNGVKTIFGTVFLKKGTRIPEVGFSSHPFNEISIVIEGCIEMLNSDGSVLGYLKKGNAIYINAFEHQAGNVLENTKLLYVLNQKV